jgi:hypothetical protein
VLATLIARFSLQLVPGAVVKPKLTITMRPYPSLPMTVQRV